MKRRHFLKRSAALSAFGVLAPASFRTAASAAEEDTSFELGCFTRPFGEFTYAEALDGIVAAGFDNVGLMNARLESGNVPLATADPAQVREIGEEAAKRGLAISSTYYGGPPVAESLEAGIEGMRRLIDNCHEAKCATILLGGTGREELSERYYEAVAALCDYGAEKGVAFVLKPHGGLNATGPQCREIVESVDHENFRIWYDPGNIFYYSEGALDPLDDLASVAGLVTGMCVKDFGPPREVAINPGSGLVKWPELMKGLIDGGFRSGPLVVETLQPGDLPTTIANATRAREFLEELVG